MEAFCFNDRIAGSRSHWKRLKAIKNTFTDWHPSKLLKKESEL
ncbi:hypothetical protein GMMP15_1750008 [Candidatus Magnetomoraceae bacterium gMMP-15]